MNTASNDGQRTVKPFWPSLTAGIALGLVLLLTFLISGHGLGASGAFTDVVAGAGLTVGTTAFVGLYGPAIGMMMAMGAIIEGDTFTDAYGIAEPVVLAMLFVFMVAVYYLGARPGSGRRCPAPAGLPRLLQRMTLRRAVS